MAAIEERGSVEFAGWVDDGNIVVLVIDQAEGEPEPQGGDSFAETGRGLVLVQELTRNWGWSWCSEGKAVWGLLDGGDRVR